MSLNGNCHKHFWEVLITFWRRNVLCTFVYSPFCAQVRSGLLASQRLTSFSLFACPRQVTFFLKNALPTVRESFAIGSESLVYPGLQGCLKTPARSTVGRPGQVVLLSEPIPIGGSSMAQVGFGLRLFSCELLVRSANALPTYADRLTSNCPRLTVDMQRNV